MYKVFQSRTKFPARRADGSFCIEIGLQGTGHIEADVARIRTWISDTWMPGNKTWTRNWESGRVELLQYDDEFSAPPESVAGPNSEVQLRLQGRKTAKWWKDWMVLRFLHDLKAAFPEFGEILYIRNCEASPPSSATARRK